MNDVPERLDILQCELLLSRVVRATRRSEDQKSDECTFQKLFISVEACNDSLASGYAGHLLMRVSSDTLKT